MILNPDLRRDKLSAIRSDSQKAQGRLKLYYQGETQPFDFFRIPLDLLVYNRNNGRLDAEMMTWATEHAVSPDHYDQEVHDQIEKFLFQTNPARNRTTLEDLKLKGQQRPGIVSLDGVVIDGNRRLMLLWKLQRETNQAQSFDAIILPDAYNENQREIVRLETQFQLGEDEKLDYGPLQKYLHARRLSAEFDLTPDEIAKLMAISTGEARKRLEIADLMDQYLHHIGCPGMYLMLEDTRGTKEGMLVDLHADLSRLRSGNGRVDWTYDPTLDVLQLQSIHFDYMRLEGYADQGKSYREISHTREGKNIFGQKDIWEGFAKEHTAHVDSTTLEMGTLEDYVAAHPNYGSKLEAARARDSEWSATVRDQMRGNFGKAHTTLSFRTGQDEPKEYLRKALLAIEKVDFDGDAFLLDPDVWDMVKQINGISYEMKRALERARP